MAGVGEKRMKVNYQLPETIQALQNGWMLTFQSAAVVSALLASIESQLLGTVSGLVHGEGGIGESTRSGRALLVITYLALFLSISATMSSLVLTQEFSVISVRSARLKAAGCGSIDLEEYDESVAHLLSRFNGGHQSWQWVMTHWFVSLVAGYISLVIQLVLYVWCTEECPVKGAVTFFSIITSLPLLNLFPWELFWGRAQTGESIDGKAL